MLSRHHMKDNKTKEKFIEMRARGASYDRIAKELDTSKPTLIKWSKELELEISNLKAMELEVLQEKYYMLKEKRIELFGEKLKAIQEEIEKRDLSDIPTEKLFDLLIKYSEYLKKEGVDIIFREKKEATEALLETFEDNEVSWKG